MKLKVTVFGEEHILSTANFVKLKERNAAEVSTAMVIFSLSFFVTIIFYVLLYAWPNILTAIFAIGAGPITYIIHTYVQNCKCEREKIISFERIVELVQDRDKIIRDIDKLAKELEKCDE